MYGTGDGGQSRCGDCHKVYYHCAEQERDSPYAHYQAKYPYAEVEQVGRYVEQLDEAVVFGGFVCGHGAADEVYYVGDYKYC